MIIMKQEVNTPLKVRHVFFCINNILQHILLFCQGPNFPHPTTHPLISVLMSPSFIKWQAFQLYIYIFNFNMPLWIFTLDKVKYIFSLWFEEKVFSLNIFLFHKKLLFATSGVKVAQTSSSFNKYMMPVVTKWPHKLLQICSANKVLSNPRKNKLTNN